VTNSKEEEEEQEIFIIRSVKCQEKTLGDDELDLVLTVLNLRSSKELLFQISEFKLDLEI
jgi:hypothetical protein